MKKEDIDSINQLIAKGEFTKVEIILAKLRKKKLSMRDKVSLSDYYDRMGNFEEGFQILGGKSLKIEKKYIEKNENLADYLVFLSCLAQKLSNRGSKYSAFNILNIVNELRAKTLLKKEDKLRILFYQINIYYAYYYYQAAKLAIEEYLVLQASKPTKESFKIHFIKAFVLSELGEYKESLEILTLLMSKNLENYAKALCLIDAATILLKTEELPQAKEKLLLALRLLPEGKETIDKVYALKWLGYLAYQDKELEEAKIYLQKAKDLADELGHFPLVKLEILHFLELCDAHCLTPLERLSLYSYFEFHPYKYVDRSYHQDLARSVFPAWPKLVNQKKSHNAFSFFKGTLELVDYKKLPQTLKYPVVDLCSQIVQDKKNERLPDLKAKAIYALLSSAGVGLSKWALADYVYAEKFVNYELSMIKLNKLVRSILKYFDKIELRNGVYFCTPKAEHFYILPVHKIDCRIQNLVGRVFTNVPELRQLEQFFKVSKPTAYRLRLEILKR